MAVIEVPSGAVHGHARPTGAWITTMWRGQQLRQAARAVVTDGLQTLPDPRCATLGSA